MNVDLTEEERRILLQLMQREIGDLGPEIRHTATTVYRSDLKDYKHKLQALTKRLSESKV